MDRERERREIRRQRDCWHHLPYQSPVRRVNLFLVQIDPKVAFPRKASPKVTPHTHFLYNYFLNHIFHSWARDTFCYLCDNVTTH